MPTVKSIAYRKNPKTPMIEVDQAEISCEAGVVLDFRGKPGKRQVTLLSAQSWQTVCDALNTDLPWTYRRANILIDGLCFSAADVGTIIQIGNVQLMVMIETDPCPRMDAQFEGLTQALTPDWRAGVCCKVVQSGTVHIGDKVEFLS